MSWYLMVWQRFAEFNGRSRRYEYWMFTLIHLLIQLALLVVSVGLGAADLRGIGQVFTILLMVYAVVGIVPYIACFVRRLHDTGRSGWWWLLAWVPVVGWIIVIVFLAQNGMAGANQYGEDPKAA